MPLLLCVLSCAVFAAGLTAQAVLPAGDARVLVTVTELKPGSPPVAPATFRVRDRGTAWKVLGWQAVPRSVQLWIALDDDSSAALNRRLDDVRKFILHLPSAFQVGVVYFSLSGAQIAAPLSNKHRAAAAAVRPVKAMQGISPDPYAALQSLLEQWPAVPGVRRAVLIFSDGVLHSGGDNNPSNHSFQAAEARAQQADVTVFGLSVPDAGNAMGIGVGGEVQPSLRAQGGGNSTMNSPAATPAMAAAQGEGNLRTLAEATGGWWNEVTLPMTVLPGELAAVLSCMQHQFYLVFAVPPGTPAAWVPLKIDSHAKGAKVSVPPGVYLGS